MTPDKERLDAVLQAAEWLLRNEAEPLTDAEKAEFVAWLKASPLNVREYLGVARAAHLLPTALKRYARDPIEDLLRAHLSGARDGSARTDKLGEGLPELPSERPRAAMRPAADIAEGNELTSEIAKRLKLGKRDLGSTS
jgi:hypothetical protein